MEPLCIPFSLSSSDLFLIANKFLCVPCKNPEILKIKCQFSFSSSSLSPNKRNKKDKLILCFFVSISNSGTTMYPSALHLCSHRRYQVFPEAVPLASSYLPQSLPDSSIFLTFQFRCHSSWECSWNPTTKVVFLPVCPHDAVLSLSQQLS